MDKKKVNKANLNVKKALKWLVRSGALLTALNAVMVGLTSMQANEIDMVQFIEGVLYTVAFMVINTGIYWVHEYTNI